MTKLKRIANIAHLALRSGRAASLCILTFLPVIPAVAQKGARIGTWTGTWATAPMRGDADTRLSGKTIRQIVHTSVGGEELRIQISNIYGDQPLQIANARVALWHVGTSIQPSSDHAVAFGGRDSVVIEPGKAAYSDSIAFKLPALADLAVSLYVPAQSGPVTFHPAAHRTNYIAEGNASARESLPDAASSGSNYFLTGVEVRGDGVTGAVVTLGASITEGYSAADNTVNRWPDVLARRLAQASLQIGVLNEGISGNRLLTEGAGPDAEERFERDVLDQPNVRWVIFSDDPINDLGSTRPAPDAEALIAATRRLIARAHRKQIRFLCSTLTPYQGAKYWRPEDEVTRERFNEFVRGKKSGCDGVIDQDFAAHDPAHPASFLSSFDVGDHLHPNDAGHEAIANSVDLTLFK